MMSDVMEIKAKADRLVELTSQQSVIKAEIERSKRGSRSWQRMT